MSSSKRKSNVLEQSQDDINDEELHLYDGEGTYVEGIFIPPPISKEKIFDTSSKTRLIITKINNNFFKSYADNETLGPFCKCFNAIIGPNGSGKSNVIDSMLFVFGYRASKIRSKKISVLLHNSEKYNNVQSATVEIHFAVITDKDGDDYEIVPGSEFVVSRTAMKDNSSYYCLNNRRVQFKEIAILLKGHGIDLDHNRFLILQGEVEQIAMMKCKGDSPNEPGMLEYLEDIIGTTRYIKPLEQLLEKVEVLTESKSEKLNRLKLVQNELDELKGPMQEAVEFLKTENEVVTFKNIIYQKNLYDLEEELENAENEKKTNEEARNKIREEKDAIIAEKNEKEDILNKESLKFNNLTKRKKKLKESFDVASNRDLELQAEMERLGKLRKKNISILAEEKKKLVQYEKAPEESEKGIQECVKKEESLAKKKEALEADKTKLLLKIKSDIEPLQEKKENLETELAPLLKVVEETKSAYTLTKSELEICTNNEVTENNKYNSLKETYENSEALLKERREQVQMLNKKIPPTEKSLENAMKELNSIRQRGASVRHEINKKRTSLEEHRSNMQQSKSKSAVLDSLMEQKNEGNCPGLFGRLGDLGGVDLKYDVAVSTACGALDSIVVDTVETGQWCIEFLRQNNIGRASFIPLEKQEHLKEYARSRIQTPENVPRLYDLIKVQDDRVRTAFYFALGDTLVADELDQASRIAYGAKRYRVVTLKGELIETTGTMSGGGNRALRGRIGQSAVVTSVNPKDLETLENEIRKLENDFRTIRDQEVRLESQINVLEPELRQMRIDFEKYSSELKSLSSQQPNLLKQLKAQEAKAKNTKSDAAQVKTLSDLLKKREAEFEKAKENANKIQVKVDHINEEIKEKSTARMKVIDKEIADIVKNINKLKTEITKLKVSSNSAERNVKKTIQNIANLEQEISSSENKLREMKAQSEEIESDGEKILKLMKEIEDELASGENDFSEMREAVEALKTQLNKLKSEQVDADRKLKNVQAKIDGIKSEMHQEKVKISQLKLQLIPDVQIGELKKYSKDEIAQENMSVIDKDLKLAEKKLSSMKPNLNVIQEYNRKMDVYMERMRQLEEISQKRNEMKEFHSKLHEQRKQEFLSGFNLINSKLRELYQMITLGGDAEFELVDTFDPFTDGIQFNVRPPKKSWKNISNLSGGEKTLSSLALVFALHYYKPSPLYIMDEIDAALDFKNVSIVGHYIKERTKNAQFLIISLRSQMFELCDNLVGIYKIFNCTKSITLDPRAYDPEKEKETDQVVPNVQNEGSSMEVTLTEALSQEEIVSSQEVVPSSQEIMDTSQEVIPSSQEIMDTSQEVIPSSQEVIPSSQEVIPSSQEVIPSSQEVIPSSQEF